MFDQEVLGSDCHKGRFTNFWLWDETDRIKLYSDATQIGIHGGGRCIRLVCCLIPIAFSGNWQDSAKLSKMPNFQSLAYIAIPTIFWIILYKFFSQQLFVQNKEYACKTSDRVDASILYSSRNFSIRLGLGGRWETQPIQKYKLTGFDRKCSMKTGAIISSRFFTLVFGIKILRRRFATVVVV